MHLTKRPLAAAATATILALSGAGVAAACDGANAPGSYPGGGDTAGTYPTTTSTTAAPDSTTATSAATRHVRRAHRAKHAKRS